MERNFSWNDSLSKCSEVENFRLCYASEVCENGKFLTNKFPVPFESWLPVADEYNDWVYVGSGSQQRCKKRSTIYGPQRALFQNHLICCRKTQANDDVRLEESRPVTVFVRSAMLNSQVYYKYSLYKENTLLDTRKDDSSWYFAQRHYSDLTSFTLMSHYLKGKADDVIYFCKKMERLHGLCLNRYSIKRNGCQIPYKLDFYLYGSFVPRTAANLPVHISSFPELGVTRVSLYPDQCCGYNGTDGRFTFFTSSIDSSFNTATHSPCTKLLRLHDKRGIILSHGYPNNIPAGNTCKWRVIGPSGSIIRFNFSEIKFRGSDFPHDYFVSGQRWQRFRYGQGELFNHNQSCPYEAVEIQTTLARQTLNGFLTYGVFCGVTTPTSFMTIDNVAVIKHTNRNSQRSFSRFILRYEILTPSFNLTKFNANRDATVKRWETLRSYCLEIGKDFCTSSIICRFVMFVYIIAYKNAFLFKDSSAFQKSLFFFVPVVH